MPRWKLKSCPRCGGDIFIDRDMENWYEQCLQCSYRHELKNITEFNKQLAQKEKEPVLAAGSDLKDVLRPEG